MAVVLFPLGWRRLCGGLLRVACGGCGGARGQAVSLLPGGREGNISKVMKVCVCVGGYGSRSEKRY